MRLHHCVACWKEDPYNFLTRLSRGHSLAWMCEKCWRKRQTYALPAFHRKQREWEAKHVGRRKR